METPLGARSAHLGGHSSPGRLWKGKLFSRVPPGLRGHWQGGEGTEGKSAGLPGNHELPKWEEVVFWFTWRKTTHRGRGHSQLGGPGSHCPEAEPQHHGGRHVLAHGVFTAHLLPARCWGCCEHDQPGPTLQLLCQRAGPLQTHMQMMSPLHPGNIMG